MEPLYVFLGFLGFIAFAISTVAGGGGALILVASLGSLIPSNAIAPVVHLGNFLGRPSRVWIFRHHIRWDIVLYYLPAAMIGGFIGAYFFAHLQLEWIIPIIAVFLISTPLQYRFGKKKRAFAMSLWMFAPLGLVVSFVSSLIGATGMVLNPFYLNAGVSKEELVGTKAVNSFVVGLVQVSTYVSFGLLDGDKLYYGLSIGVGALIGNVVGKRWLAKISDKRFLQLVILLMFITGCIMLAKYLAGFEA